MANLIIQENGVERTIPAVHGEEIAFEAPCDCTAVTGVKIAGEVFPFYNSCGNDVSAVPGKFTEGNLVRVLIDAVKKRAQIINDPLLHAHRHKAGRPDPLTAADVEAMSRLTNYKELSTEGWYTIGYFQATTYPATAIVMLGNGYTNTKTHAIIAAVNMTQAYNPTITVLTSNRSDSARAFTQLRVVKATDKSGYYLEAYYSGSRNQCYVTIVGSIIGSREWEVVNFETTIATETPKVVVDIGEVKSGNVLTSGMSPIDFGAFPRYQGLLTSADDCNNIGEDGIWVYNTSDRPVNAPFSNAGIIMCLGTDHETSQRIQLAWRYGADGNFKYRIRYNGWREWTTVYTSVVKPTADDVGARPNTWVPTADETGAYNITTRGTNITTSSDLHNYTTPGSYYAQNTNASSKITNAPAYFKNTASVGGFKLIVEQGYSDIHTRQTIYGKNQEVFVCDCYDGAWSAWERVVTEKIATKIEQGSYVGNGNTGPGAPNTLTFGFVPKMVAIYAKDAAIAVYGMTVINGMTRAAGRTSAVSSDDTNHLTWSGKTLSWYNEDELYPEELQLNSSGKTYYYVAIG